MQPRSAAQVEIKTSFYPILSLRYCKLITKLLLKPQHRVLISLYLIISSCSAAQGSRMEDADQTRLEELLMCPVCQDTFKDPRQLPCGHSMCMDCLTNLLDHSTDAPFRCPDCRADFGQVVNLQKSYALASIAEDFKLSKKRRVGIWRRLFLARTNVRRFFDVRSIRLFSSDHPLNWLHFGLWFLKNPPT